jgi:hypothetical protein
MDHARLGTAHVGGSGHVYYPPETARWRMAALAIALTFGVAGSFAIGQALGHHAPTSAAHRTTVTHSAGSATGALSTASGPTPTAHPALPSAAPAHQAQPVSDTSHKDQDSGGDHGGGSHQGGGRPAEPGQQHGGGNGRGNK